MECYLRKCPISFMFKTANETFAALKHYLENVRLDSCVPYVLVNKTVRPVSDNWKCTCFANHIWDIAANTLFCSCESFRHDINYKSALCWPIYRYIILNCCSNSYIHFQSSLPILLHIVHVFHNLSCPHILFFQGIHL